MLRIKILIIFYHEINHLFITFFIHTDLFFIRTRKKTFEFTDSIVTAGQIKEIQYVFFLCGKINESDLKTFDSIKIFLKKHEHLTLELGIHFSNGSIKETCEYGNIVKNELGNRGTDTSRTIVKGYGHTTPKIPHVTRKYLKQLYKAGNYYEVERLHMINDRIELKILTQ